MKFWVFMQMSGEAAQLDCIFTNENSAIAYCEKMQQNTPMPPVLYFYWAVNDSIPERANILFLGDWVSANIDKLIDPVQ